MGRLPEDWRKGKSGKVNADSGRGSRTVYWFTLPLLWAPLILLLNFSGTMMQTSGTVILGKACTPLHGEVESWMTCLPAIYGLVIKIQFTGECSILINCPVTALKLTKGGSYTRLQTVCGTFLIMTTDSIRNSRWKKSLEQFTKQNKKDLTSLEMAQYRCVSGSKWQNQRGGGKEMRLCFV